MRSELSASQAEVDRLRAAALESDDELLRLRDDAQHQDDEVDQLRRDALDADGIERSQRALIARLRESAVASAVDYEVIAAKLVTSEHELLDLRAIRDALTPPVLVQRDGLTLAVEFRPAEIHVGGDFHFVGDGPDGSVVMVVGDVVGKGTRAARRAAFTRTAFAAVSGFSDEPRQLLEWVNVALVERAGESDDFVTAGCVTYHPERRVLRWAYAGHPPALRLASGDQLEQTKAGLPLGIAQTVGCSDDDAILDSGEGLLLFTDGLTEAKGSDQMYGMERVAAAIRAHAGDSPGELLEHLCSDVIEFASSGLDDDLCLIAMRGNG